MSGRRNVRRSLARLNSIVRGLMNHRVLAVTRFAGVLWLAGCMGGEADARKAVDQGNSLGPHVAAAHTGSFALPGLFGDPALRESPAAAIDSARPMSVLIERFQQGLPGVTRLGNGAASREALVRDL